MRRLIAFWILVFLLMFAWQWYDESDLRKLKDRAVMTTGRVIAALPEYHRTVRYEFEAGGRTYISLGGVAAIGKRPEEMRIGDLVPVYYLPDDPGISRIGDPRYIVIDLKSMVLSSICFSTILSLLSLLPPGKRAFRQSS